MIKGNYRLSNKRIYNEKAPTAGNGYFDHIKLLLSMGIQIQFFSTNDFLICA